MTRLGDLAAARALREDIATTREFLAHELQGDPKAQESWARSLNDLAWLLVEGRASLPADANRAVELAERAVVLGPEEPAFWNTLGLAYHRAGRWEEAEAALGHSSDLGGAPYQGANDLILSLVLRGQGQETEAARCLARADAWLRDRPGDSASLQLLRAEGEGFRAGRDSS
jgi:tetratricopeptide (TPR) repeat protein